MGCAVYFINRLSVSGHRGAVLYYFWCSRAVLGFSLDHPYVFGCTGYASLLDVLRDRKLVATGIADMHGMICGPQFRRVSVSNQVGFDGSIFLLADETQIIDFHEFATSTTRMKASVYSKMMQPHLLHQRI